MNKKIDLVSRPKKSFWKLSIPIVAFCIFDAIYALVDMAWVSQISEDAFFAIGISIPIITLVLAFGDSLGQGTNSLMSRFIGADNLTASYNTIMHGILLNIIIWLLVISFMAGIDFVLPYLGVDHAYNLIFAYLSPLCIFSFTFIFVNMFSETLQAEGDSTRPTILIIGSNILNMILDPIFIFDFNMGIAGAAYATILSSLIVFVSLLGLYLFGKTKIPLSFKYFKFEPYIVIEILKVALPNFISDSLWCFSSLFINYILISTVGQVGVLLFTVSSKIRTLLEAPIRGFGRGLMSVTGHLFGARHFDDLKYMYYYVLRAGFLTMQIVMVLFNLFRDNIFDFFQIIGLSDSIAWIGIAGIIVMICALLGMISSKMLDGFGKSLYSLLLTIIKIILQAVFIYILTMFFTDGSSVLIGLVASEVILSAIYFIVLYYMFKTMEVRYENKETVKQI